MPKRIALVDADGILYAAALGGQTSCDGKPLVMTTAPVVYKDALKRLEEVIAFARVDDAIICLSDRRNFRYDILSTYKGQRKASDRPILLDALRTMFVEMQPYPVMLITGLEADDVCGIAAGQLQKAGRQAVIVSPDKDMLSIPNVEIVNRTRDGKLHRATTTQESADNWHIYQTLVGDTVDNYKGCPGVGPRRAGDLKDQWDADELTLAQRWQAVIRVFDQHGKSKEECLQQARVARILRVDDWDATNKEVLLWDFPAMADNDEMAPEGADKEAA